VIGDGAGRDAAIATPPGAPGRGGPRRDEPGAPAREAGAGGPRRPLSSGALVALVLALAALATFVVRYRYGWLLVGGPEYRAAFADVSGLGEGADVRYAGMVVGRVRRVTIDPADPRRVLVTVRVREGTPVRASTRAAVVAAGGRPVSYVNLRPGDPAAPALAAGARIASEQGPTIEDVLTRVTLLLDRADTLVAAAAPLADPRVFAGLARTVARVDTLVGAAARSADRWGPALERAAGRTDAVLARTERLLARTDRVLAVLDSARPALARAPGEAVAVLEESRALLADVRAGVGGGGGVRELVRDLTAASENMARFTERLEREPLSVLRRRGNPPKPAGPALRE
jgi:phospholipid/cholesterol/gamma-HCH transport system substrate-binding protein